MPSPRYYYHSSCYNDFAKKRGRIQEQDLLIELDNDTWKDAVYQYFKKDLKITLNYFKFNSQWNKFLGQGMTAKGIYFTVRYFYEQMHGDKEKSENGIGIVPYVYDDATKYWGERNLRDKELIKKIENQVMTTVNTMSKVILQKNKKRSTKIDLDAIASMEDNE